MKSLIPIVLFLVSVGIIAQEPRDMEETKLTPAPTQEKGEETKLAEEEKPATENHFKFAFGLNYNSSNTAEADLVYYDASAARAFTGTAEFDVKSYASLEFEVRHMQKQNWGFTAGLSLGAETEEQGGTIVLNGVTIVITSSADPDKMRVVLLYGNAVYRFDEVYIPFGLNVSAIDYKVAGGGAKIETEGGLGAQFGLGYQFGDHVAFELLARSIAFNVKFTDLATSDTTEYKDGHVTNLVLGAKYIF